jgi:hypothetical protein
MIHPTLKKVAYTALTIEGSMIYSLGLRRLDFVRLPVNPHALATLVALTSRPVIALELITNLAR